MGVKSKLKLQQNTDTIGATVWISYRIEGTVWIWKQLVKAVFKIERLLM